MLLMLWVFSPPCKQLKNDDALFFTLLASLWAAAAADDDAVVPQLLPLQLAVDVILELLVVVVDPVFKRMWPTVPKCE